MNAAPPTPTLPARLEFVRAIAAEMQRYRGPHHAEAVLLVKFCRLWRSIAGGRERAMAAGHPWAMKELLQGAE